MLFGRSDKWSGDQAPDPKARKRKKRIEGKRRESAVGFSSARVVKFQHVLTY